MNVARVFMVACLLPAVLFTAPAAAALGGSSLAQQAVRVKEDGTRIYQAADPASKMLTTVPVGATLDLLAEAGEWYRVRQRSTGIEGFVAKTAVEVATGAAIAGQAPGGAAPGGAAPGGGRPASQAGASGSVARPEASSGGKTAARKEPSWNDRGYLAVSGAYQASNYRFTDSFSFPKDAEQAQVAAAYRVKGSTGFDAGGGYRVWRSVAIGVQVSRFSRTDSAVIDATIPHPLYLRRDRSITGAPAPMARDELAVHLQAAWVVPVGKKMFVTIAAGPSWFKVRQAVVENLRWTELYPYDTVTFESAEKKDANLSRVGANAGVDVAYYLTGSLGVGATVRYAGANVSVPLRGGAQSLKAGGAQAAVGMRVRFRKPAPRPKPMPQPPPKMPVKK